MISLATLATLASLPTLVANLEGALAKAQERIAALEAPSQASDLEDLEGRIDDLESQASDLEDLEGRIDDLESQASDLEDHEARIDDLEASSAEHLESRLDKIEGALKAFGTMATNLGAE